MRERHSRVTRDRRSSECSLRPSLLGGWWARVAERAHAERGDDEASGAGVEEDGAGATLIEPCDTSLVECRSGQLESHRRRLQSLMGETLTLSPLPSTRGRDAAVLVRRDALRRLPAGTCAVPPSVALAALGALQEPRRRVGVYWGHGESRWLHVVRRGAPRPEVRGLPRLRGLRWLTCTPPDRVGLEALARLKPTSIRTLFGRTRIPLSPLATLALGVALAAGRPGTFPPPPPGRTAAVVQSLPRALSCLALAGVMSVWLPAERRVADLETRAHDVRVELERLASDGMSREVLTTPHETDRRKP